MVSSEDLNAWQETVKGCKKLEKSQKVFQAGNPKNVEALIEKTKVKNLDVSLIETNLDKNYTTQDYATTHSDFKLKKDVSLGLDKTTEKKLKTGEYQIDVRLDLHGLTLDEAYARLKEAVELGYQRGDRLILVITGKGSHSIGDMETLKSSVPQWLSDTELASKIIKYTDAQKKHGGSGALYILLRKAR